MDTPFVVNALVTLFSSMILLITMSIPVIIMVKVVEIIVKVCRHALPTRKTPATK